MNRCFFRCLLSIGCVVGAGARADDGPSNRLITLPIEQLMQFEVNSVSRYPQSIAQIPAAISIVTAADIKTYGYRTLADVLNSMRGLYVSYDRNYSYLGVRGFATPGDYNTRVLLLVDGVRYNDAVYSAAALGTDFPIDVDLFERVEFISGPTSVVYGSNAFFGVINVITKNGSDLNGTHLSGSIGSADSSRGRASMGGVSDDGANWLISATRRNQSGEDIYFPEFDTPDQNHGVAEDLDADQGTTLLAKYQQRYFTATLTHGERTKSIPTASFYQAFNTGHPHTTDEQTNLGLEYRYPLNDRTQVTSRLYAGRYIYRGIYIYAEPLAPLNRDTARGDWIGGESALTAALGERHKLLAGLDYRNDVHIWQKNIDVAPRTVNTDDKRSEQVAGFFAQDEIKLGERFTADVGLRFDRTATHDWETSPRAALIYSPSRTTALKFLYGSAFRTPNAYERYYYAPLGPDGMPMSSDLHAEQIRSHELLLEHAVTPQQRLSFSLFRHRVSDLIFAQLENEVLLYRNGGNVDTHGIDTEWQLSSRNGTQMKVTYNWQQADSDARNNALTGAPRTVLNLNIDGPLGALGPLRRLHYGIAGRALSARATRANDTPGYGVIDFTLRASPSDQLEISASIYNLFDRRFYDPGTPEMLQDRLMQDGRTVHLKLDYRL